MTIQRIEVIARLKLDFSNAMLQLRGIAQPFFSTCVQCSAIGR